MHPLIGPHFRQAKFAWLSKIFPVDKMKFPSLLTLTAQACLKSELKNGTMPFDTLCGVPLPIPSLRTQKDFFNRLMPGHHIHDAYLTAGDTMQCPCCLERVSLAQTCAVKYGQHRPGAHFIHVTHFQCPVESLIVGTASDIFVQTCELCVASKEFPTFLAARWLEEGGEIAEIAEDMYEEPSNEEPWSSDNEFEANVFEEDRFAKAGLPFTGLKTRKRKYI